MRVIGILLSILSVALLASVALRPGLEPAEDKVLRGSLYGYAGGLIINTALAVVAPHIDPEIPPQDAMVSCAPYGIVGGILVTRMHAFSVGGWGSPEWAYIKSLPRRTAGGVRGLVGVGAEKFRGGGSEGGSRGEL